MVYSFLFSLNEISLLTFIITYYQVNKFLLEECGMKEEENCIGLVVHSECNYFSSLSFPEITVAGSI